MNEVVKFVELPKINDFRGDLTFIEKNKGIDFEIESVSWFYETKKDTSVLRIDKGTKELIIALIGSFNVVVKSNAEITSFELSQSNIGLYIDDSISGSITNFSRNCLGLRVISKN